MIQRDVTEKQFHTRMHGLICIHLIDPGSCGMTKNRHAALYKLPKLLL